MYKFLIKHSNVLTAFAVFVTTYAANRNCTLFLHQPELPQSAKKLRKF